MANKDDHLRSQHYPLAGETAEYAGMLQLRCHAHLLALCDECRRHWEQLGPAQTSTRDRLQRSSVPSGQAAAVKGDDLSTAPEVLAVQDERVVGFRRLRRRAQEEAWELLRLPASRRRGRIRGAHRRFRSRHLAQLLLEECRSQVRSAPDEARRIAELVPLILRWVPRDEDGVFDPGEAPDWAPSLFHLSAAHRANALRVAGELPAAERAFAELRLAMRRTPPRAAVLAEITSLEGSLRIDQRRLAEAEDLLGQAALGYASAGDDLGVVRVQIKQANLLQTLDRPEDVLSLMADAADRLSRQASDSTAYLLQCSVTARVNALCDLSRFAEAENLLASHLDTYEASDDPYPAILLRGLRGRVALGLERYAEAEVDFTDCRDGMLDLGRGFDAALAALYLGEVFLAQGRTRDLKHLVADLIPRFEHAGVDGEALRAMRQLVRAVTMESLTFELLQKLRFGLVR